MSEKSLEKTLADEIKKRKLTPQEMKNVIVALRTKRPSEARTYKIGKDHVRYLAISDTHIGNVNYDADLMTFAAEEAKKQKVDFVIHGGDIVDGWYQNRPQQVFELNAIGADQQIAMARKELGKFKGIPLYFITANHEWNTYMRGAGIEIGMVLQSKLREDGVTCEFLGNDEGNIVLKNGTRIKMLHPDGGSSYAISYKPQKIVESLEGGKKPHVLHIGHFHKAGYFYLRNVHTFLMGTMENQTKFMKGQHLAAMKGFYIIDLFTSPGGQVDCIIPRFYPAYE